MKVKIIGASPDFLSSAKHAAEKNGVGIKIEARNEISFILTSSEEIDDFFSALIQARNGNDNHARLVEWFKEFRRLADEIGDEVII